MTHRHDTDQEIIEYAIQRPAKFIGLIGSHSKWARFRQRLILRGVDEKLLLREVRCPVRSEVGRQSSARNSGQYRRRTFRRNFMEKMASYPLVLLAAGAKAHAE